MQDPIVLAPGIHRDYPAELYHRIDAVSYSRLKELSRSPAHLKHALDNPQEPTDAMHLGSIIHVAVLEPRRFDEVYAVMPAFEIGLCDDQGKPYANPKATNKYKALKAEWESLNRGREPITSKEAGVAKAIAARLSSHEDVAVYLQECRDTELTLIWNDPKSGLLCKARIDGDCPDLDTAADLKSTTDASFYAFEKKIFDMRYYWQGAFYLNGLAANGQPRSHYSIIPFETDPPFEPKVYRLRSEVIELAQKEIAPLMQLYKVCKENDFWPGYPTGVEDIGLPGWAINRIEKDAR